MNKLVLLRHRRAETPRKYGAEQVRIWRRGYAIRPPALEKSDPGLEIPTEIPLVYELDAKLTPHTRYYLGDSTAVREAQKELIS